MRVAIVAENFLPKIDGSTITLAHLLQHLSASNIRALLLGPETGMSTYAGAHLRRPPAPLLPPARPLRLLGRPPDDDDVLSVGCLSLEKNLGLDVDAYAALVASLASLSDAPLIFVAPNAVTRCSPVRYDHSDLRAHQHEHESECGSQFISCVFGLRISFPSDFKPSVSHPHPATSAGTSRADDLQ
ncbi:hypothetical protein B0H12DRAFT_1233273 [Mycena haematopus]|nr:hypothetical protein B0H12DRAFT_1233273 [Mycena haematopus]